MLVWVIPFGSYMLVFDCRNVALGGDEQFAEFYSYVSHCSSGMKTKKKSPAVACMHDDTLGVVVKCWLVFG